MTIVEEVVTKKFRFFEVFRVYFDVFYIILDKIFLLARSYQVPALDIKIYCKCPSHSGNEAKRLDFCHFSTFLAFFELPVEAKAFSVGHFFLCDKLIQCIRFHV